jgi:plastocyanin
VDPAGRIVEAMTPRLPLLALGLAAVVAGCGSTASGSTTAPGAGGSAAYGASTKPAPAGAQKLELSADPGGALRFDTTRLTAKAGTIELVLTNPGSSGMPHGIAVQGHGSSKVVDPGRTATLTVSLKKGEYTFLCPVPGHAAAGMKGTLTVR